MVLTTRFIGDTFSYQGEKYKVVESENKNCQGCVFDGNCRAQRHNHNPCASGFSPSKFKYIIFVKIK